MFFKGVLSPDEAGGEDTKLNIFSAYFMARDNAVTRSLFFLQQGHVKLTASWRLFNIFSVNASAVKNMHCVCVASMQHAPCMCVASMWKYAYPRCVQLAALATLHLASSESGTTSAAQGRNFHK